MISFDNIELASSCNCINTTWPSSLLTDKHRNKAPRHRVRFIYVPLHNVYFVKYGVTVSFMAQVLDTVTYFVSHVLVVDTVTYFDIFR